MKKQILNINPKIIIHIGKYKPTNLDDFNKAQKYMAFSGIGNHQTFISMLKNYGLNILKHLEFPDHYQYSNTDIRLILNEANKSNCKIITTEKDYFRLNNIYTDQIQYIKTELQIIDEEKLAKMII